MTGVSAGMLCWFRGGVTDSFGGLAALNDGLGLIDATACPHYDGEGERRPTYHRLVAEGFPGGFAADDGAALYFGEQSWSRRSAHGQARGHIGWRWLKGTSSSRVSTFDILVGVR